MRARHMHCRYCHRPIRLLDSRHPQRLLLPRCRVCRNYTFGLAHKAILLLLVAVAVAVLVGKGFAALRHL